MDGCGLGSVRYVLLTKRPSHSTRRVMVAARRSSECDSRGSLDRVQRCRTDQCQSARRLAPQLSNQRKWSKFTANGMVAHMSTGSCRLYRNWVTLAIAG